MAFNIERRQSQSRNLSWASIGYEAFNPVTLGKCDTYISDCVIGQAESIKSQ